MSSRRQPPPSPGQIFGAPTDQAAILALASSNEVPQQHRMLERPVTGGGATGAAGGAMAGLGGAAGGGTSLGGGIIMRTRIGPGGAGTGQTEIVMMDSGGTGELCSHSRAPRGLDCLIGPFYNIPLNDHPFAIIVSAILQCCESPLGVGVEL